MGLEEYYLHTPGDGAQKRCVDKLECAKTGYYSETDRLCLTYFQCALFGDGVIVNDKCVPQNEWIT